MRIVAFIGAFAAAFLSGIAGAQDITGIGDANVQWTQPMEYEDGTPMPLSALEGYVVFYGPQSRVGRCEAERPASRDDTSCYPVSVVVSNGAVMSRKLEFELTEPVTLYFAVAAETKLGKFSRYSVEASKTITLQVEDRNPGEPTGVSVTITIDCTSSVEGRKCEFIVE